MPVRLAFTLAPVLSQGQESFVYISALSWNLRTFAGRMNTGISKSPLLTRLLLHSCAYACMFMPGDVLLEEGGDVLSPWTLIATGIAVHGSKISFKILNRTGIPRLRQNMTGFCKEIIIWRFYYSVSNHTRGDQEFGSFWSSSYSSV